MNTYYTGDNEHLWYRSWPNTYTGVDWTLIIQQSYEHLLCRSRLNTYYTGVNWTVLLYWSWLNTYCTGVDWTLTIQELTEHNYYTRGVETKHLFICRSWLNTNIKTYKSRLNTYLHKLALELNSYLYPAKSRLNTCIIQGPKFLHVAIRIVILLDTTVSMNCKGVKIVSSASIFCGKTDDKLRNSITSINSRKSNNVICAAWVKILALPSHKNKF